MLPAYTAVAIRPVQILFAIYLNRNDLKKIPARSIRNILRDSLSIARSRIVSNQYLPAFRLYTRIIFSRRGSGGRLCSSRPVAIATSGKAEHER